jgi:hypothetical protein
MLVKIFQQGTAFIGLLHRPIDQDTKRFRMVGYESGVNCERLPLAPNEKLKREANDDPAMAKHNEDDSDGENGRGGLYMRSLVKRFFYVR